MFDFVCEEEIKELLKDCNNDEVNTLDKIKLNSVF